MCARSPTFTYATVTIKTRKNALGDVGFTLGETQSSSLSSLELQVSSYVRLRLGAHLGDVLSNSSGTRTLPSQLIPRLIQLKHGLWSVHPMWAFLQFLHAYFVWRFFEPSLCSSLCLLPFFCFLDLCFPLPILLNHCMPRTVQDNRRT